MVPADLAVLVRGVASDVLTVRGLDASALPAEILLERPRNPDHGDYATSVAMRSAKKLGMAPRELAGWLAAELRGRAGVAAAEVAGPGFVNVRLASDAQGALVGEILAAGESYGLGDELAELTVDLEFVSANPTGPLHLAGTRCAAFGDALARVLSARGAKVAREYYFNDAGEQVDLIAGVKQLLHESDGAWWLRRGGYGDDKERSVTDSAGTPAYLASDVTYLRDKGARGHNLCIYLLGADRRGYVARLKAAAAFGDASAVSEVLIGQPVNLVRDGRPTLANKRAGTGTTLDDLVDAVGVDAARYALVRSSADSVIDIDLDLLTRRSNDNPVFYVQYVHARLCSLADNAVDLGLTVGTQYGLLEHPREGELIRTLGEFPETLRNAAQLREPHRVARYLESLAAAYHRFYDSCRVLPMGDEPINSLHRSRLALCAAARQVFANGLGVLGVSAPERM